MPIETRKNATSYSTPLNIWIILIIAALFLTCLIGILTSSYKDRLMKESYRDAGIELSTNASALSSTIASKLLLSNGIRAFVNSEIADKHSFDPAHFELFASTFIQQIQGIRNLSIYPNGIAKFVYPLKNNEKIIGLNLFTHPDPAIRGNAERTKRTELLTLLGPFELTQGGMGILSRQSIFEGNQFWGFVSIVLDVPSILQEADLYNGYKGIDFAVRANNQVIMGDPRLFEASNLIAQVPLPEGYWEIAAVPKQVKLDSIQSRIRIIQGICAFSLLLILYFMYVQLTQKAKLQSLVKERTLNLETANQQLEATYNELTSAEEELRGQFQLLENKEQAVRHMAYHDAVTGLYNRSFFNECVGALVMQSKQSQQSIAILFLDLDNFKLINDSIGHTYGDILLNEIGRRLSGALVEEETIARIGGDEFTIILPNVMDAAYVRQTAGQVIELFQQPFLLKDIEYFVTTSIGVALFPDHGEDASSLIRHADMAMYRAKEEGKNQYRFYDQTLNPDAEATVEIKNSLRRAIERDEFIVHYQPQIDVTTGRIIGLEALIRWMHPKRGMISPCSFIPVAEDSGLIVPISERVLQIVCAQSKAWQKAGLPPIRIAVNLSARQLMQKDLTDRVKQILDEAGLDPLYIELEITENMAMKDDKLATLHELRNMGFTISIDDFGTQYSSLSYLKRLPINKIKIDRSFISGIARDRKDEAIILAMLLIAQRLNLTVIAEGVETKKQLAFLQNNNCTDIQGFLFHKPLPADRIEPLLREQLNTERMKDGSGSR